MVKLDLLPEPAAARILLIEDEVSVRMLMAEQLRMAGFCVIEADRADEALDYVKAGGQPDLVFSDVRTPGSLDGTELARHLRQRYPSLPIILTSGSIWQEHTDEIGLYIPKPYRIREAVALVQSTLAEGKSGG